jgi:spore coat protein U-like protein
MNRILIAAAVLGLTAVAAPARAATATANLAVNATVTRSCTIAPATLAFGNYDPASGVGLTSQALTVKCNQGFAPTIAIGNGANFGAGSRRMANGSDFLAYALTLRANGLTGDTVTPAAADATGTVAVSVEGSIPAGQWVTAAATQYSDVVTMTVTF